MSKKNMRRISILVTAQTAKNLERLASMCGYREIGMVVDKLTREKMISLHTDALMPGERKGKQMGVQKQRRTGSQRLPLHGVQRRPEQVS